jgi:site-specific DNA-methyltransferase (adenine-specific)
MARKPIEKGLTVAENVIKWGTGAINIDASRISTNGKAVWKVPESDKKRTSLMCFDGGSEKSNTMFKNKGGQMGDTQGRWPANLLLDEQAAEMLGDPSRFFYVAKTSKSERNKGLEGIVPKHNDFQRKTSGLSTTTIDGIRQKGNCGQPNQNHHPTVKPIKLMKYLITLITPSNGIVLDPFMGSGSTGVAAKELGFDFIGIELNEEYLEIAKRRISG